MGVNRLAGIWGLAEATFFFIVPDVWLSMAGRKKLSTGLVACIYSLVGALIGGLVMLFWGVYDQVGSNEFLERIPAINIEMIDKVNDDLIVQGLVAVLLGPLSGTPYKIYAVQAGGLGIGLWGFMLVSIPARLIRFILVTMFFHYSLKIVNRVISEKHNIKILLISWLTFYVFYFIVKA